MLNVLADVVERTRQHHAIEHATIHVLTARHPDRSFSGYSDPLGFTIYGNVDEHDVRTAVGDALLRLQAGERQLAIHPNCGTNLLTTAVAATLAALSGALIVRRGWLERVTVSLALTLAAISAFAAAGLPVAGVHDAGRCRGSLGGGDPSGADWRSPVPARQFRLTRAIARQGRRCTIRPPIKSRTDRRAWFSGRRQA